MEYEMQMLTVSEELTLQEFSALIEGLAEHIDNFANDVIETVTTHCNNLGTKPELRLLRTFDEFKIRPFEITHSIYTVGTAKAGVKFEVTFPEDANRFTAEAILTALKSVHKHVAQIANSMG